MESHEIKFFENSDRERGAIPSQYHCDDGTTKLMEEFNATTQLLVLPNQLRGYSVHTENCFWCVRMHYLVLKAVPQ